MQIPRFLPIILGLLTGKAGLFAPDVGAQLVSDGSTVTLNHVTNSIAGDVTIGTNGSFTLLVMTNGTLLTNSGNGYIGRVSGANSNAVHATSANTRWLMALDNYVGNNGAYNRLVISNGARVENNFGALGIGPTSSNNEATVTGGGSLWSNRNDFYVGYVGRGNSLLVTNAGRVSDNSGIIGADAASSNNQALVTGASSIWSNRASLFVGFSGNGNRLVATNGGSVVAGNNVTVGSSSGSGGNYLLLSTGTVTNGGTAVLGAGTGSNSNAVSLGGATTRWICGGDFIVGSNGSFNTLMITNGALLTNDGYARIGVNGVANSNLAIVSGTGSVWAASGYLLVGGNGSFNRLVVSNGAVVAVPGGDVGYKTGSNNEAIVTGPGSLWTNTSAVYVGYDDTGSRLVVTNGGSFVTADALYVGSSFSITDSLVVVDGGTLRATNAAGDGLLEIRGGTNVLNGGLVEVDQLHLGDTAGFFELNGGRLVTHGASISNGASFVVGRAGTNPAVWDIRAGMTNHSLTGMLQIGSNSSLNQLIITNGALLSHSGSGLIGVASGSRSNLAFVSGAGSQWLMTSDLTLGANGGANRLIASNGAVVVGQDAAIGEAISSSNNEAVVTGSGTLWSNLSLTVGSAGPANRLTVSSNATVFGLIITVGGSSSSSNNRVIVDGGVLRATNAVNTGPLRVQGGTNVLNNGRVETDRLLITNPLGEFEFNGGTLQTENTTNSNGRSFFAGNGTDAAFLDLAANGVHIFANGLTIRSNAAVEGSGTVIGTLTVLSGGSIAPGLTAGNIGKLILTNPPVLEGSITIEVSKNGSSLTNDLIQVAGTLAYGGSLIVVKTGPTALSVGDQFSLFNAGSYGGAFSPFTLPALSAGLMWTNKLLVNGSIQVVAFKPPRIGSISRSGTNVILRGSGGTPGAIYNVLTATNAALPLTNWTPVLTNSFDWLGNFTFTNGISPAAPRRFFLLRVP